MFYRKTSRKLDMDRKTPEGAIFDCKLPDIQWKVYLSTYRKTPKKNNPKVGK